MRPSDVKRERLALLETGTVETNNFMEQIALDQQALLGTVLPNAKPSAAISSSRLSQRMWAGAQAVLLELGPETFTVGATWTSDTARSWASMAAGLVPDLSFRERLDLVMPFAADSHFGVREWAWIGLRDEVAFDVAAAVRDLLNWAQHSDERLRRFSSEATRPRGVWSRHIVQLKENPGVGLPLLDTLKFDSSRYVQLSVGNWLNDASKTRPGWVRDLCEFWESCTSPEVSRLILRRARRSLRT